MKAFLRHRYGSPDVLALEEVDRPEPTAETILVRVHATSTNAYDWHVLRGKPYIARLGEGFRRPKDTILGLDVAGVVEAVGTNVDHVQPGDRVFGSRYGAFAEYVAGKNMVPMPAGLSFEEAAALPTAGLTALQGLRDHGHIERGQRVLVNGAGGGVGHLAVQIASAFGAEATAVTRGSNAEMLRAIGADHVLDYARDDFTRGGTRYDLILDAGGNRSLASMARVVKPGGRIVLVAPGRGQWIGPIVRIAGAAIRTRLGTTAVRGFLAKVNRDDLLVLKELVEAGKLRPVIERTYAFEQTPDAIRLLESGRSRGKIVITVRPEA